MDKPSRHGSVRSWLSASPLGRWRRRARASAKTRRRLVEHAGRAERRLEIGPGPQPLKDFETLGIADGPHVDYVLDAARTLPFGDASFDLIYASHVLEHIPWYQTDDVLREWRRILKPGGVLEIWVPDGLKICRTLVEFEVDGTDNTALDGWYRMNPDKDPCRWAAGRMFTYGDGAGATDHPNWHRALFTPRFLAETLVKAGFASVRAMDRSEVRGDDHGWINLGARGVKPDEAGPA